MTTLARPPICSTDGQGKETVNRVAVGAVDLPPSTELLQGLDQRELDVILAGATRRRFLSGSVITRQGDPAEQLLLLCKGRARYFLETFQGKKLILIWITPGQIFGGAALVVPPASYLVSAEAVRDSTVLVWEGSTIRSLARRFPRLMANACLIAMNYLSWYVGAHAAFSSQTARERLAHLLMGYAPSIGQRVNAGIELNVTNEELSAAAGISPYTTSRIISEWQKTGAIRKNRGKIVLREDKRLFLPLT